MRQIAKIMGMVARDFEGNRAAAQEQVVALTKRFPIYE
jgi:glycine hydroxymethyltransferase